MESCMLIEVVNETVSEAHTDAHLVGPERGARRLEQWSLTRDHRQAAAPRPEVYADGGIPVVDDRMRLPSFDETCPHVCDRIIPLNGGRFNVDHYLRVLRSKAETDDSLAMALTARR